MLPRLRPIMKSDSLLWLALVLFLSSLSAQGATAIDHPPPMLKTTFTIVENQTENETVGQLVQYGGANFRFSVESTICSQFFTINRNTSVIRTVGMLDREAIYREMDTDQLQCFIQYDNTSAGINANVRIIINILDINDEVPHFSNLVQPHVVQVVENLAAPAPLLRLEPIDDDSGVNGTVQFNIINGDTNYFMIMKAEGDTSDTATRLLFLQRELDFEVHNRRFDLTIRISDMGNPSNQVFDQQIVIIVNNSLDEPPTFPTSRFVFQVPENHLVGITHPFANVTAANPHEVLGSIFYYLCEESGCTRSGPDGVILVNEVTGGLYLNQSLEYDELGATIEYTFYVKATNPSTGASQNAFVQVMVEDVNDHAPYFTCVNTPNTLPCPSTDSPGYPRFTRMNFSTGENELTDTRRLLVAPNDEDRSGANTDVEYNITSDPRVNVSIRNIFSTVVLGIDQQLDRELTPDITIIVTIRNTASPQLSSTAVISVHVEDLNDNAPTFTQALYNAYISEGSPVGKKVATVEANDSDADENGKVSYSITAVDKETAENWFQISPTGVISVAVDDIDYHAVQGVVVLNVTAMDNGEEPLSSTALVEVEIVPAVTFSARSYQAFASYNLATAQDLDSVYLEFQTSSSYGVLLHHQGDFTLGLEEKRVVFRHGGTPLIDDVPITDNVWYSVLLENAGQDFHLEVWRTGSRSDASSVLLEALTQNCSENEVINRDELLFIGGMSLTNVNSSRSDFVGAIRNVIIGQSQVNLRCPQEEENTLIGVQRSNLCRNEELKCHPIQSMGCVDYAEESFCRCKGGFASQICSNSADSFAPIRLHGNSHVTLDLPYSFFYDLQVLKQSGGNEGAPNVPGGRRRRRRKRGQVNDPMLQKVDITFTPVEVGASVLLHSESQRYIHQLMILNQYAIVYKVFDKLESMSQPRDQVLIPNVNFQNETEYQVSITYNNVDTTMAITGNEKSHHNNDNWDTNPITLFAEQPETSLSIGGAPGRDDFFIGCIKRLKIDEIDIPLSGLALLSAEEGGFTYNTSLDSVVEPYCNLCDLATCPSNMTCASDNYGGTSCVCPTGYVLDELVESCLPIVVETPVGPLVPGASSQSISYIAGGTGGGVLLVGVMIILLIVIVRTQHVKHDKRKRTYSVTSMTSNGILPPQRTSKSGNEYVRVEPRRNANDSDSLSALGMTYRSESRERGSSVSTFQEHADDADPEIDAPPRLQRRKSTVSAESGIRTDTERDSSIRGTSRMDDSGTDYTPQESESDDMTSSCFMEPVDSASSVMGVPVKVASPCVPLTPQERKVITPLRPDSICLSINEDDHHDTFIETDISSCTHQAIHHNRPLPRESDNDTPSTPKWYKSSTASDNERESERAHKNTAYYPTCSEPMQYPPHPPRPKTAFSTHAVAPDYVPPPSISARKSASPAYPHSPTRRYPPTMISAADSPLTRNTHKYENYPLPYSSSTMPRSSDSVRGQGTTATTTTVTSTTRGAIGGYDNHRLQHQISAPLQEHHSGGSGAGQQPRHVYFAKSSHTLHYSHSVGNGSYASSKQQTSHPNSSRQYYNTLSSSTIPTSLQYRPNRSYSSSDAPPPDREPTQFQDLKNVSTINPITYWETQDRLKPAVDQVDPYQVLSEPYIQFEDVSTDLSVSDSQGTLKDGADHEVFESQGGGEGVADMGPGCLTRLQDHHDIESLTTDSQSIQGSITHFPSADCSNEYTATIHGASSSGDSTPKFQPSNGMIFPSQQSFDV